MSCLTKDSIISNLLNCSRNLINSFQINCQQIESACPDVVPKPSHNGEGSTEQPNTVHNVGDDPEQEDPKTKVIFYNLDFFIKTE